MLFLFICQHFLLFISAPLSFDHVRMDGGRKLWYLEEHANSAGKEPEPNPEPATGPTTEAAVTPLSLHPISISQHRKVRLNITA